MAIIIVSMLGAATKAPKAKQNITTLKNAAYGLLILTLPRIIV